MVKTFAWQDQKTWPFDTTEYVFFARAMETIGHKIYGAEWTGKEITSKGDLVLPLKSEQASSSDWRNALAIGSKYGFDLQRVRLSADERSASNEINVRMARSKAWSLALEACRLDRAAHERLLAVMLQLRSYCASGALPAALQREDGSINDLLPPHAWNNHAYETWFAVGKAPLNLCFDKWPAMTKVPHCWLYLERQALSTIVDLGGSTERQGIVQPVLNDQQIRIEESRSVSAENSAGPAPKKYSSQRGAVDRAMAELWGGQLPQGLTVERRDEAIRTFAKDNGLSTPSSRTIRRHLQAR